MSTATGIKTYRIGGGGEFNELVEVVIRVDLDKLTTELATELNLFWAGHGYRLSAANGDPKMAVIRFTAAWMIGLVLEGNWNAWGLNGQLHDAEGYSALFGILECVHVENNLDLDSTKLDVNEVTAPWPAAKQ